MTGIVFEKYTDGATTASMALPLRVRGFDAAAFDGAAGSAYGALRLPLRVHGTGLNAGTGTAQITLPLHVFGMAVGANGAIGRVSLPPLSVFGYAVGDEGTITPNIGVGSMVLPFDIAGNASSGGPATSTLRLPLRIFGTDSTGVGHVHLPRLLVRANEDAPSRYATLYQLPTLTAYGRSLWEINEGFSIGDSAASEWVMVREALLAMGVYGGSLLDGVNAMRSTLTFADVAGLIWNVIATDALALGETAAFDMTALMEAADGLALSAGAGSALDALNTVVAALQLGATAGYSQAIDALEKLALAGAGGMGLLMLNRQTEQLALSGTGVGSARFVTLADDGLALAVQAGTTAELVNQITEGLEFLVHISLPDGEYLAWVCNTASRAFTSYRNFPFNSFCELGGHYYGATDEGIYLLEGDDDAGVPIDARIRGGLMDMGTGKLKRQEAMYLGYRADGRLLLKVVTTDETTGAKAESWYSLAAQPAQTMREGRIKIGRGLKSVYWGFEVANIDGADFELDSLSWLPMVLDRRI